MSDELWQLEATYVASCATCGKEIRQQKTGGKPFGAPEGWEHVCIAADCGLTGYSDWGWVCEKCKINHKPR